MTIMVPNQGELIALEALVNKTAPQDLRLKLYKNNKTPTETDTEADYTEADFTGYAFKNLAGANWNSTGGAPSDVTYNAVQTFTSSAGSQNQPVYGYYLVQQTSGKLVYAERFTDGPYTIVNNGDNIAVTPKLTGD
jgi:hypothetical protein